MYTLPLSTILVGDGERDLNELGYNELFFTNNKALSLRTPLALSPRCNTTSQSGASVRRD